MQASNHVAPAVASAAATDRASRTAEAAIARTLTWAVAIVAVGLPQVGFDLDLGRTA